MLGLVVADMLYRRLPKANEGELNRTLMTLVRKETCAAIARELDLGPELNLGESEARTGGAEKEAILGDAAEAVIGAIYCDGGLGQAYEFVERLFGEHIGHAGTERADAKTTLQEWAQGRGLEPPALRRGRAHRPRPRARIHHRGQARRLRPARAPPALARSSPSTRPPKRFLIREKVWKETL